MKTTLSAEQLAKIAEALPPQAVKPHPTRTGMSTIKAIFVTERFNDVFGVGEWSIKTELLAPISSITRTTSYGKERTEYTALAKTVFEVPLHGIYYECIASSTNDDMGDAAKGATTDAITKIASWIGIGIAVFKGEQDTPVKPAESKVSKPTTTTAPATKTRTTEPVVVPEALRKLHQEYMIARAVKGDVGEKNDFRFIPNSEWDEEKYKNGINYFNNKK